LTNSADPSVRAASAAPASERMRRPTCGRRPSWVRGIEDRLRSRQRRLARAHQRLDAEQRASGSLDDRLVRHPQPGERELEADLDACAIHRAGLCSGDRERVAPQPSERVGARGVVNRPGELVGLERLGEIPKRTVLDGGRRGFEIRLAAHQDHRNIEIDAAHAAEQVEAVTVGHVDVAEDHVERLRFERLDRRAPSIDLDDLEVGALEHARDGPSKLRVVVGEEHARVAGSPPPPVAHRGVLRTGNAGDSRERQRAQLRRAERFRQ